MATKLDKLIEEAEKNFEKFVSQENWSEANMKLGFWDAATQYDSVCDSKPALDSLKGMAEEELSIAISEKEYGLAAYWRSYISGWMAAEIAHELDMLRGNKFDTMAAWKNDMQPGETVEDDAK